MTDEESIGQEGPGGNSFRAIGVGSGEGRKWGLPAQTRLESAAIAYIGDVLNALAASIAENMERSTLFQDRLRPDDLQRPLPWSRLPAGVDRDRATLPTRWRRLVGTRVLPAPPASFESMIPSSYKAPMCRWRQACIMSYRRNEAAGRAGVSRGEPGRFSRAANATEAGRDEKGRLVKTRPTRPV